MHVRSSRLGAIAIAASLFCNPYRVLGDEPTKPTASATEANPAVPAPGHSVHGEPFNEGPRHAAYLMPGMGKIHFAVTTQEARGPGVRRPGGRTAPLVPLLRGRAIVPPGRHARPGLRHGLLGHGDGERQ